MWKPPRPKELLARVKPLAQRVPRRAWGAWGAAIALGLVSWGLWPGGPPPAMTARLAAAEPAKIPLSTCDVLAILERNPLGIDLERKPPPPPPAPVPVARPVEPPPKPTGPIPAPGLKLVGTMAGPGPQLAIIQEPGGTSGVYAIGERVAGRTVVAITRKRVNLASSGGIQYLVLADDSTPQSAEAPGTPEPSAPIQAPIAAYEPPAAEPQPAAPTQVITRELPRDEVLRNLGNPANFLSQLQAEPYYENSRFAGYYVQEVKTGSYAATLGVLAGDILETVNGDQIDSLQKAFRLIGVVQRAPEMTVAVRRGTERLQMTFRLQ